MHTILRPLDTENVCSGSELWLSGSLRSLRQFEGRNRVCTSVHRRTYTKVTKSTLFHKTSYLPNTTTAAVSIHIPHMNTYNPCSPILLESSCFRKIIRSDSSYAFLFWWPVLVSDVHGVSEPPPV